MSSVADNAKSASDFTKYIVMVGIAIMFLLLSTCGTSLEMVCSLIYTLQLISFLPLMVPFYPDHVKIMFELLEFSNMDIALFSDFFKKLIGLDTLSIGGFNSRFSEYGIETPLFLDSCASLIFSLCLTILMLIGSLILYRVLRCERVKAKLGGILSSYYFNNFLRFMNEGYLEMAFGSLMNLFAFTTASVPEIVSSVLSIFVFALCVLFP